MLCLLLMSGCLFRHERSQNNILKLLLATTNFLKEAEKYFYFEIYQANKLHTHAHTYKRVRPKAAAATQRNDYRLTGMGLVSHSVPPEYIRLLHFQPSPAGRKSEIRAEYLSICVRILTPPTSTAPLRQEQNKVVNYVYLNQVENLCNFLRV